MPTTEDELRKKVKELQDLVKRRKYKMKSGYYKKVVEKIINRLGYRVGPKGRRSGNLIVHQEEMLKKLEKE